MKDTVEDEITDHLSETLVGGISGFTIHNDAGGMPIDREVTCFTLFQAINSLPEAYIEPAYEAAYQRCDLTPNALSNWKTARDRYSQMHTCPYVLAKIIRYHNSDYYTSELKPILNQMHTSVVSEIEISDHFDLTEMIKKAERGLYKKEKDVLIDLSKFVRRINAVSVLYLEKIYNAMYDAYEVVYVNPTVMRDKLKSVKLWKEERKQITAWNVLDNNSSQLTVRGVLFNSHDPSIYSLFRGHKYNAKVDPDMSVIRNFLEFTKHVIAGGKQNVYEYILNWISLIMQKPGIKTGTVIILKGLQGTGKGTFTDTLSEMLSPYAAKNVTNMDQITGNFNAVIEGRSLIVLNEVKNAGTDRYANYDALKSIISEAAIWINEKCQPRHESENVANFIFCTNNWRPVKLDNDDRRYMVLDVAGGYRGNFKYWNELRNTMYDDWKPRSKFFDSLTSYFIQRDISDFNVRVVPWTEEKADLIAVYSSPIERWIGQHYDQLLEGIHCKTVEDAHAILGMKKHLFLNDLKKFCTTKRMGKRRLTHYVLKEDCRSLFKQTQDVDDDISFEEEKEDQEEEEDSLR